MLRVLVVDDEPDCTASLHWLLRAWGHDARAATDGGAALAMSRQFQPDVVILDLAMPGMDGYKLAGSLRQLDREKPIIIAHSGYCTEEDVRRALDAGCNYHLAKPAEPDEVQRLLEAYEQLLLRRPST